MTETGSDWDQLSIETPELVAIEMPLAGLGSRFAAILLDYLIWTAIVAALLILMAIVMPNVHGMGEKWAIGIGIFLLFVLRWGYFTLFEAFWNGRTPGKRMAKIRVIQRSGRGISLFEAMTRNLLRFIDEMPFFYAIGVITIFFTQEHQRLGDLAAGTLVVHERSNANEAPAVASSRTFTSFFEDAVSMESPAATAPALPLSQAALQRLDGRDLEVLEGFFARRLDLDMGTREALASRIALALRRKSGLEVPQGVSVETFLEEAARQLRDLVRIGGTGQERG